MTDARNMLIRTILLCLIINLSIFTIQASSSSLKLVSVLYNHGDSSPQFIYPKDINKGTNVWPDGLGWLSNIGKQQQYKLGQWLNKRYTGFLNTSYYHHEEIIVASSSIERCLMSAYSNLAGFFPPKKVQKINPHILWQPISVFPRHVVEDNTLIQGDCPRYNELLAEAMTSREMRMEEERNKDFFKIIENETGVKIDALIDIQKIADTLDCERTHNMTWNDWANKPGIWNNMLYLRDLSFSMQLVSAEMAKFKGGPLLKEILENMNNASKVMSPMPKLYMYSALDTTVASLLSAINVFDKHQPMSNALVIIELHQLKDDRFVKIFYKNTSDDNPIQLSPPGCPLDCNLDTFMEAVKERIPVEWYRECQVVSSSIITSWIFTLLLACLCAIIAVILIVIVLLRVRARTNELSSSPDFPLIKLGPN